MDKNSQIFLDMVASSIRINKLYNELYILILNDMNNSSYYEEILSSLHDSVINDNLIYNNLGIDEVNFCLNKLDTIKNKYGSLDRVKSRLDVRSNILSNMFDTVKIDNKAFSDINGEYLLADLIEYCILVNTYRNVYLKITTVYVDNIGDKKLKENLLDYYYLHFIDDMRKFKFGEMISILNNFNVIKLLNFDTNVLIKRYAKMGSDIYYYAICDRAYKLIDDLLKYQNENSIEIIFNTLVKLHEVEVILSILDGKWLDNVIEYFNFNASFVSDTLSKVNVRRLIRERNKGLSN